MDLNVIPLDIEGEPDRFIIFRPLLGLAWIGNGAMANLAQEVSLIPESEQIANDGRSPAHTFLRQIGFLQPDPPSPVSSPATFCPTTAVLLMTNQCQLRCTYCYAMAGEFPPETLTVEQSFAVIDAVCANAMAQKLPQFEVSFHGGGEPTLAWQVLQECVLYARQKPLRARLTLTSNGIWSKRQRDWIVHNIDGLTLSWDGAPETQDRQRPFASGQGSAEIILAHIAELDRQRFPYSIRMTATAPWETFVEGVRYICQATQCGSIQVEPAFNTSRGGHGHADTVETQGFVTAFMAALGVANQSGRRLMYSGARLGTVTTTFCTAPYEALIVTPRGTLVTCYEVTGATHPLNNLSTIGEFTLGTLTVHETARGQLHGLIAERRQACQDCFCYWSCAGDCYTRTFQDIPDGHQIRGPRCTMNQAITRRLLLNGIAEGQGVWRRSAPTRYAK